MTVFVDLDGVMADFEKYFEEHFGFRHDTISDNEMWHHIDNHENFFGSLPLMPDAMRMFDFIRLVTGENPTILTACPKVDYPRHALAKIDWVHERISHKVRVLPVYGGKNKALFLQNAGDVLIDDFEKNLIPWRIRGGLGILHKSPDDTIARIDQLSLLGHFDKPVRLANNADLKAYFSKA